MTPILPTLIQFLGMGFIAAALIALCEAQYRKLQSRGKQAEWDHVERRQWGRQALPMMPTRHLTEEDMARLTAYRVARRIREDALSHYDDGKESA